MDFTTGSEPPGGMPMLRVQGEERVFDREAVLGRDASSVFPTEARAAATTGLTPEGVKEALGAPKFVTETELEQIKSTRGESVEDGTISADKSLAEVLASNAEKKDEEFQAVWKSMKQGKNRPLDDDEVSFLDNVYDDQRKQEMMIRQEEEMGMAEFHLSRAEMETKVVTQPKKKAKKEPPPAAKPKPSLPIVKPKVKVKAVVRPKAAAGAGAAGPGAGRGAGPGVGAGAKESDGGGGLGGLLGDYGSGSDSDSD